MEQYKIPNKDIFEEYYNKHTIKECSEEFRISEFRVKKLAKEYNLSKWTQYPIPSKEEFEDYYNNHTNKECEEHFGVSSIVIGRWTKIYSISKPTKSSKCPKELTDKQMELIIGSMLGDGCISKKYKNSNCFFSIRHSTKQKSYLYWKSEMINEFARKFYEEVSNNNAFKNINRKLTKEFYESIKMETVRHLIFTTLEKKWYLRNENGEYVCDKIGRRIKVVPKDIKLTPFMLAIWYFDDGRNTPTHKCCYLSTDGFNYDECLYLCELIKKLDIDCKPTKTKRGHYEIYIRCNNSYYKFLDMVREFLPCKDFNYKVELAPTNTKVTSEDIETIFDLKETGLSRLEISKITNVAPKKVKKILSGKHKVLSEESHHGQNN